MTNNLEKNNRNKNGIVFDISNSKMEIDNTCSLMCHLSPEYHGMAVKQTKIQEADP